MKNALLSRAGHFSSPQAKRRGHKIKMENAPLLQAGHFSFFVEEPVSLKKPEKTFLRCDGRQHVVR
ncbi:MAG: hypothetical protein JST68_20955 [Bacteroidetes bacterium]|nr:hypothetical protein [Bacteroidota bacterium]